MRTTPQHSAVAYGTFGVFRSLLAAVMTVVLFVPSLTYFVYNNLASQVASKAIDIAAFSPQNGDQAFALPDDAFKGRPVNILVSGIDSRYDQGVNAHGDPEEFSVIFSDVTMVMHVSADRSRINTVSIPRDLMTEIPSCLNANGIETDPYYGQFNSAFSTGAVSDNKGAGIACTKNAVEQLTGLTIDGFMLIDFNGFVGLVDAIGGIWYDVETRIVDEDSSADLYPGCQRLNGQQALSYARVRKSVGDGSDLGRVGRQQKLVAAMMREALSKNYVTDLPALLEFVQKGISAVNTSPSLADLNTDVALLLSLTSIKKENIQFITMPVVQDPHDLNRVVANDFLAERIWHSMREDLPFPADTEVTTGAGTKALTTGDTPQSTDIIAIAEEPLESQAAEEEAFGEDAFTTDPHTDSPSPTPVLPAPCPPQQ